MKHWTHYLVKMGACAPAVEFCSSYRTPQAAMRGLLRNARSGHIEPARAFGWVDWLFNKLVYDPDWQLYGAVRARRLHPLSWYNTTPKSLETLINAYPTPTLADLKSAAAGRQPWIVNPKALKK